MESKILEALESIPVADLTYTEWVNVGMALKAEGYDCSVWDNWSKQDSRYHQGECERKWRTFQGNGVKGGTIVQMAKERGWKPYQSDDPLDWNDVIEYDGYGWEEDYTVPDKWSPTEDLITYLELLFEPDDIVGYVTGDVWQNGDGKWVPSKGIYNRTAGELIKSLRKHPDDIGATVGDWKEQAGAWIRFNPLDGNGVKNDNVARFKYALVESDTIPISEQEAQYRKLELPIAALVHSGGKSLHAIVHIDADDYSEYRKRVEILYDFLEKNGVPIDKQNRNPSRLSRMPGITRNGNKQYLVETNLGRKSWNDWMDYVEGISDELPEFTYPADMMDNRPPLSPELIKGLLRVGHKMIVSGASKSGKSFFLIELGISISEGREFLGFGCMKGNVLYINLEIDTASCLSRVFSIYDKYGIKKPRKGGFVVWNLRGHAMPLDKLVPKIIRRLEGMHFDAIIIDPIYKVITGDENSASEMGYFCNQFDKICDATGCSIIYAHHHSKGAQAGKAAQDRASGSGVFARDPDALIDLVELDLSEEIMNEVADSSADTAWQMDFVTRDFAQPKSRKIWFKYPLHVLDNSGALNHSYGRGDPRRNLKQNKNGTAKIQEEKDIILQKAFEVLSMGEDEIPVKDIAEYMAESEDKVESKRREIYRWVKSSDKFLVRDGMLRVTTTPE
ncbi:MAG: AAA family ATPase [Oscillospiraceae bacterium]|nr:AAA family ATPase [Oscillospiraceae bacterium]